MFLDVMANNVKFTESRNPSACDYNYKVSPHDFGGPPAAVFSLDTSLVESHVDESRQNSDDDNS